MFIDKIEKTFGTNTPIFTDEIVALFDDYTRAYVFQLIKRAEMSGELTAYSRGIYYIPRKTFFGKSTICPEMAAEKKYIRNKESVYGIYSGLNLLNRFGITSQVPNIAEIVTNNETTRKRKIKIGGREFILRKARCEITKDNYPAYTLLQLFNDMNDKDKLDEFSRKQIVDYIVENGVKIEMLFDMSGAFPSAALKKMIGSGILNGTL